MSRLVDIDTAGVGPWWVKIIPPQRAHPMFHGDSDTPTLWSVNGPGEMAQLFEDRRAAVAVCAVLNALDATGKEGET